MLWYMVTRPETVFSVVQVGCLPDVLPSWITERILRFFPVALDSTKESTANVRQTFLLEAEIPETDSSDCITSVMIKHMEKQYRQTEKINPQWLKRICVSSEAAKKLLLKLFKNECPLPIEIVSEFFPQKKLSAPLFPFFCKSTHPLSPSTKAEEKNLCYIRQGDLLESKKQTLVNAVNCVGVMGKGIAYTFKFRYPEMFSDYKEKCRKGKVKLGKPCLYKHSPWRWILNFPTKQHWRNKSNLQDIEAGLVYLAQNIKRWGITSLAIPPLGCGNGGLNWNAVYPLIEKHLGGLLIPIEIYIPFANRPIKHKIVKASADHKSKSSSSGDPIKRKVFSSTVGRDKIKDRKYKYIKGAR